MSDRPEQGNLADPDATNRVLSMALGLATVQLVRIAAQFGIADALQDGPRSSGEIAAACGMFGATAARVVRALVGIGILTFAPLGDIVVIAHTHDGCPGDQT